MASETNFEEHQRNVTTQYTYIIKYVQTQNCNNVYSSAPLLQIKIVGP